MDADTPPEGEPQGWVDPRYADVLAYVSAHAAKPSHRSRGRKFPFSGVHAFVLPTEEGRRVACCTCLHTS